jgi:hypothetical protein
MREALLYLFRACSSNHFATAPPFDNDTYLIFVSKVSTSSNQIINNINLSVTSSEVHGRDTPIILTVHISAMLEKRSI